MTERTYRHSALLCLVLTVVLRGSGFGQAPGYVPAGLRELYTVTVRTDIDSALVIIDDVEAGVTPLTIDTLRPGLHRITLVHPDVENWLATNLSDSFFVNPGEARTLHFRFEPRYIVSSYPFEADVVIEDSAVGTTPLLLTGDQVLKDIRIRKDGYEPTNLDLARAHRGVVAVPLKKIWPGHEDGQSPFADPDKTESGRLRVYITGSATILSGAAAAFFKVRADERYDLYRKTGEPSHLEETRRLDRASAVALCATQVGLALIVYFLLLE
jgi:hypothetical protein